VETRPPLGGCSPCSHASPCCTSQRRFALFRCDDTHNPCGSVRVSGKPLQFPNAVHSGAPHMRHREGSPPTTPQRQWVSVCPGLVLRLTLFLCSSPLRAGSHCPKPAFGSAPYQRSTANSCHSHRVTAAGRHPQPRCAKRLKNTPSNCCSCAPGHEPRDTLPFPVQSSPPCRLVSCTAAAHKVMLGCVCFGF